MRRTYHLNPIGVIRSNVKTPAEAPKQGAISGSEAEIVVDPAYAEALDGLDQRVGPQDTPHHEI